MPIVIRVYSWLLRSFSGKAEKLKFWNVEICPLPAAPPAREDVRSSPAKAGSMFGVFCLSFVLLVISC